MTSEDLGRAATPSDVPPSIHLDITNDVAAGRYANLVLSNATSEEFILDFAMMQPGTHRAQVHQRIILSPRNAKRLSALIQRNVSEFESKFGIITDEPHPPGITLSFN